MTKMVAKEAMLRHHRRALRQMSLWQEAISKSPKKPSPKKTALVPVAPETPSGDPTPQRAVKAVGEVAKAKAPPFNSQILSIAQKFSRGLGPEVMIVLERLHEIGHLGQSSRGMTSSYEGVKVDGSAGGYEHLSAVSRDAADQFRAIMEKMPPELQKLTRELVLEDIGMEVSSARGAPPRRSRTAKEIGQEVCGYESEQRALGATSAVLRVIAWIARSELGFKRRK
jgi:hypothetical protein